MTDYVKRYSASNIPALIAEVRLDNELNKQSYSLWLDRKEKDFKTLFKNDTIKNSRYWNTPVQYVYIGIINQYTDYTKLEHSIKEEINKNIKEFSVYTSLSNHAERIQRNEDWE